VRTWQRLLAAVLILVGAVLVWQALTQAAEAQRRTLAVLGLAASGVLCNVLTVGNARLAVRSLTRNLATAVAVALVIGLLGTRAYIALQLMPELPERDAALRAAFSAWQANLAWLAIGMAYATVSVALLPTSPRSAPAPAAPAETPLQSGVPRAPESNEDDPQSE
jgi:hypothetical protein